jgi:hypothetical protein
MAAEHAPKFAIAIFAFAAALLGEMFVDKNGARLPTGREVRLKLPAIILAFLLCLVVIFWMTQLRTFDDLTKTLAEACRAQLQMQEDADGPIVDDASLKAERKAVDAVKAMSKLWAVRRPLLSENAPCD